MPTQTLIAASSRLATTISGSAPKVVAGSRWGDANDPTGLVRRLLGRLRPAVAP